MSRELPERPSLDHLKKQAKALLRQLKRRDQGARLTAAQHALALEYGFASWRQLRAHVQRIAEDGQGSWSAYAFDRYTPAAKLALFFSRDEASQVGRRSIDPEHVLLGSIRAGRRSSERFFAHVSIDTVREEITTPGGGAPVPHSIEIPFSGLTRQVLLAATGEADRLGHHSIGIAHLLLGMLDETGTLASTLLTGWGITRQRVKDDLSDLLDERQGDR